MRALSSLDRLAETAEGTFSRRFGRPPSWLVVAPGRINLIGEHTDYNDGFVLPMAIDRHIAIAADRRATSGAAQAWFFSTAFDQCAEVGVEGAPAPAELPAWAAYVQGVAAGFAAAGLLSGTFEAVIHSDLPVGGGLSSSAALEVAVATLLEALAGVQLEPHGVPLAALQEN
ncbi:MAG: galactokinase family protein [Pirellulales bacterium]